MELEKDYKRECESCSGTESAYSVEARYKYHEPMQLGEQIFDNRWRRVHFRESVIGVPACASHQRRTKECGLLGYAAAQALRWWVHATAEASAGGALCLETRLVSHKITYSHKVEATGVYGHIHGEDRSNCIPDWGKNTPSPEAE